MREGGLPIVDNQVSFIRPTRDCQVSAWLEVRDRVAVNLRTDVAFCVVFDFCGLLSEVVIFGCGTTELEIGFVFRGRVSRGIP